jgi:hypothetical protein
MSMGLSTEIAQTKVLDDADTEIFTCSECILALANDEWPADASEERIAEMRAGFEAHAVTGYCLVGPSEHKIEFSTRPCECCRSPLHGERHSMIWIQP